jgi:hypothetical protein
MRHTHTALVFTLLMCSYFLPLRLSQRRESHLPLFQRSAAWCIEHPVLSMGALAAPFVAYGMHAHRQHPHLPPIDKVMKTSIVGQVSTCYHYC